MQTSQHAKLDKDENGLWFVFDQLANDLDLTMYGVLHAARKFLHGRFEQPPCNIIQPATGSLPARYRVLPVHCKQTPSIRREHAACLGWAGAMHIGSREGGGKQSLYSHLSSRGRA